MQTGVLRYPPSDRFVRIQASILILCGGNACAAALISFFENWHNYRLQQKEYTQIYNQMLADNQQPPILEPDGWQYHTNLQLERGVMIYKIDAINAALEYLENELGFISTDVPERLKILHKTGRTRWFLLMTNKINEWIADFEMRSFGQPSRIVQKTRKPKRLKADVKLPENDKAADALKVFNYWRFYCNHKKSIADPERLKIIMERLEAGFSVIDLCLAIEGCLSNPFYQGQNKDNRIHDRVEMIFKSNSKVEDFMSDATKAKKNAEFVKERLEFKTKPETKTAPNNSPIVTALTAGIINAASDGIKAGEDNDRILDRVRPFLRADLPLNQTALYDAIKAKIRRELGLLNAAQDTRLKAFLAFLMKEVS